MKNDTLVPQPDIEASMQAAARIRESFGGTAPTYFIESYGCQMNDHDSEKLAGMLREAGYTKADDKRDANCILFNTCCIREHAEHKVFGNIGALKKRKDEDPSLIIGVCGCMPQQPGVAEKLFKRFPFLDMIFGTHELHRFPELLEQALRSRRVMEVRQIDGEIAEGVPVYREGSFSTNVTITYGCDNYCSYCIVPYVRGRERSRSPEAIVQEVRKLADAGYSEITLLGQNVNSYSVDGADFPELLRRVHEVGGIRRIRFMTSHPKDLSPRLMQAMAELPNVCDHLHLPVQSGSSRILKLMNRKYDRERYMGLVDELRSHIPGIELTTDIIVGFPGETEQDFQATLELVKQIGFAAAFTFMYSPRKGTAAEKMLDQVPQEVKKERLFRLNEVQAELTRLTNQKYIDTVGEVLVEGYDRKGMAYGKLTCFKMVYFPGDEQMVGSFKNVRITSCGNNSLIGEAI